MKIKYWIGCLLKKMGYKIVPEYRWPKSHGNLTALGFSLLKEKNKGKIQIIQIGAFDGSTLDPISQLLLANNVRAVLLEPQKAPFEKLVEKYSSFKRIKLINSAVAEKDGDVRLFVPSKKSSLQASLLVDHATRFGKKKSDIQEIWVKSISIPSLLSREGINNVDLLQIDTEGMDFEIIKWFFQAGIEPKCMNFESFHLSRDAKKMAEAFLIEKGYWFFETGQDTFAIKESLVRLA